MTEEGRLDAQTPAGHGPAVAVLACALGKPVVAFVGNIPGPHGAARLFAAAAVRDAAVLLLRYAAGLAATRLTRFVPGSKAV